MKLITLIGTLTIGIAASVFAGDSSCNMPPASKCSMMPSSDQNSRENLTWMGPVCCKATDNHSADLSSQNSRHAILTKGQTSEKIGTTTIVYSEKNGQSIVRKVDTR